MKKSWLTIIVFFLVTLGVSFAFSAPMLQQELRGLSGHIGIGIENDQVRNGLIPPSVELAPSRHALGWGVSYYNGISPLKPTKASFTQLGFGTFIKPNGNEDEFGLPNRFPKDQDGNNISWCPEGALPQLAESLEGGVGSWGNVDYPTDMAMFSIVATANCYDFGLGGPAYQPNGGKLVQDDSLYFAQLSNRLLIAPDAITLERPEERAFLGSGWLALPIIPEDSSPFDVATGSNSWTLFFRAENFSGAVGFFTPAFWTHVIQFQNPKVSEGYGLDTRAHEGGGLSLEIGFTMSFTATANDVVYKRIPKMTFTADDNRRSVLMQDLYRYSKAGVQNQFLDWFEGGAAPQHMDESGLWRGGMFVDGPDRTQMLGDDGHQSIFGDVMRASIYETDGGGQAFGLEWNDVFPAGVIPEYYKKVEEKWHPILEKDVPSETHLTEQIFEEQELEREPVPLVDVGAESAWNKDRWSSGPVLTFGNSGSTILYVWYKFIEQPAIARLKLTPEYLQKLQIWSESLHGQGDQGWSIPLPSSGTLASIDAGLLVNTPEGLERGYVPIAIGQWATTERDLDTDGDGVPNDCDSGCLSLGMLADADDDNDGVEDSNDAFPLDSTEAADADADRVGDNKDAFPNDSSETTDSDGDAVGDNSDAFPLDASESVDTDGDGLGNNADLDDDDDNFTDEQELVDGTDPLNRFSCRSGCFSFDVDENLEAQPLTDGLLVIRHLFGFSGDSLTSGAVSGEANRDGSDAIASYLTDADSQLDIDGDGESKPLTDGLLLIRYLFGFSGDSLISGAIGSGAERDTAEEVEAYIEERVPAE